MLGRTGKTHEAVGRQSGGDSLLSITYFGLVGAVMIIWISAIGWAGWRLIEWMIF